MYTLRKGGRSSPACLLQQKTYTGPERRRGELQAGVQQLLLSLGKHWLFVFFRKISPVIQVHNAQIARQMLTAFKRTHQIDLAAYDDKADDLVSLLEDILTVSTIYSSSLPYTFLRTKLVLYASDALIVSDMAFSSPHKSFNTFLNLRKTVKKKST